MTSWTDLQSELKIWADDGRPLPFWWRDDDAISDTPELRQLAEMAEVSGLPVIVAVIPSRTDHSLSEFLACTPHVVPVVHGWAHENHAPTDEKKAEFGAHRPLDTLTDEVETGFGKLHSLLGSRLQPMFVPPWNRVSDDLIPRLPELGFRYLSTSTPRKARWVAPGLEQVNTHIDPIDWRGTRGLIAQPDLIQQVIELLRDRRSGRTDNAEPLGLLTHHLVHDPAIWSFCARLIDTLLSGPATPWAPGEGTPHEPS